MAQVKRMKMANERQEKSWMCILPLAFLSIGIPLEEFYLRTKIYLQVCYHSHSHDINTWDPRDIAWCSGADQASSLSQDSVSRPEWKECATPGWGSLPPSSPAFFSSQSIFLTKRVEKFYILYWNMACFNLERCSGEKNCRKFSKWLNVQGPPPGPGFSTFRQKKLSHISWL